MKESLLPLVLLILLYGGVIKLVKGGCVKNMLITIITINGLVVLNMRC